MINLDFVKTGNLIKELRINNNITQQELANLLKVSKPAVSQWEKGNGVKLEYLYLLSKYFNLSVEELLIGKLKDESNISYFKRNYSLYEYNLTEIINNHDYDKLKEFCNKSLSIIKDFYKLIKLWCFDKLSNIEDEEFNYLTNYFYFISENNQFLEFLDLGDTYKVSKENLKNLFKNFKDERLVFELNKYYKFKYDFKLEKIIKDKDSKALEIIINLLPIKERDILFTNYINNNDVLKLNNDEIFKIFINNNSNYLNNYLSLSNKCMNISNLILENIDGEIQIINEEKDDNSYEFYINNINKNYNKYLKALNDLKNSKPYEYYQIMKVNI